MEPGIPAIDSYNELSKTQLFKDMEGFSDRFIRAYSPYIERYKLRWVSDPFHQWGRQWEYPFVFEYIDEYLGKRELSSPEILDAGSGITFFPYYCASRFQGSKISCCDYDSMLGEIFDKINREEGSNIIFKEADIRKLPFKGDSFDIIYCISVLEHTCDYSTALSEFKRVLKKGGLFVITFDISLDGIADISIADAKRLINEIEETFNSMAGPGLAEIGDLRSKKGQIITTDYFRRTNPGLLPWRFPALSAIKSNLVKGKFPFKFFKDVTCFCMPVIHNRSDIGSNKI